MLLYFAAPRVDYHPLGDDTAFAVQQREFQAFAKECDTSSTDFLRSLKRYLRVYEHALDPSVPAAQKRVLVVRDALAMTLVGLGIQAQFYSNWLLFGMALGRAVFFSFCEEEGLPWLESARRPGMESVPCDSPFFSYDLGDYFYLLGGADLRWTPERREQIMGPLRNMKPTIVSSCSLDERPDADPPEYFICNCCGSDCADYLRGTPENILQTLPEVLMERIRRFWLSEELFIPWIEFEYRSSCTEDPHTHWRYDTRKAWYGTEMMDLFGELAKGPPRPLGCSQGPQGATFTATVTNQSTNVTTSVDILLPCLLSESLSWQNFLKPGRQHLTTSYSSLHWAHCAMFAMFQPTRVMQAELAQLLPLLEVHPCGAIAGVHIRTMAMDYFNCMPPWTNRTWEGIDAAWDYKAATTTRSTSECRRSPSICVWESQHAARPRYRISGTDAVGSLSGLFQCVADRGGMLSSRLAKRRGWRVEGDQAASIFLATDAHVLQEHVAAQYGKRVVVTDGLQAIPTWNRFGENSALRNLEAGHQITVNETRKAHLKAALDFYLLGIADFIMAPVHSFFSDSAARRSFPWSDVLGSSEIVCELIIRSGKYKLLDTSMPLELCFKGGANYDAKELLESLHAQSLERNGVDS
ncbi:hypothetical protein CYMTET_8523 [Cymbomonas tetramitiformis]|uniref:Uncharacterized protein n=1 Tax=Cymbomonas tetramitiformis TaxID=36881 RepID=A0AAE0LGF1_9CHLO|nr:hypothetical protein CYMTET_8523 [Cymbomonas tetramitiformis]